MRRHVFRKKRTATAIWISVLLGPCVAWRTLQQDQAQGEEIPCGEFLEDTDVVASNNTDANSANSNQGFAVRRQLTQDACLQWCLTLEPCTAFSWTGKKKTGTCWLKNDSEADLEATGEAGVVGYVLCPNEKENTPPLDPMPCGEFINGKDLYGWDLQPGNASTVATAADCIALCLVTTNCNALTWLPPKNNLGKCYLKNIPEDVGALDRPAVSSYRLCEDEVVGTGGNAANPVATGGNCTNETAGASSDGADDVATGGNDRNQTAGAASAGASGVSAPPLFPDGSTSATEVQDNERSAPVHTEASEGDVDKSLVYWLSATAAAAALLIAVTIVAILVWRKSSKRSPV